MQALKTLSEEIQEYKKQKNALILAHYYQNLMCRKSQISLAIPLNSQNGQR